MQHSEKYQAWRCDWLLRWEAGADPDDPQAILWRHSVNGATHRARRIHDYLNRYGSGTAPSPQGLPARLFIFATLNISPDVLRVLATQAQVGTLHFYLPTPTKEYWGDAQPFTQRLHQPTDCVTQTGENRLLHTWGAAGRDFMTVLGNYEVVHPSGEITAYDDPEQRPGTTLDEGGLRDSLLQRLHADLFHNRSAPVPAPCPHRVWKIPVSSFTPVMPDYVNSRSFMTGSVPCWNLTHRRDSVLTLPYNRVRLPYWHRTSTSTSPI